MTDLFDNDPTPEEEPINPDDERAIWKQKVPASYWNQFKDVPKVNTLFPVQSSPMYWKPPVPISYHAFFDDDLNYVLTVDDKGELRMGSLAVKHKHVKQFWNRIHDVVEPVDFARVCKFYSDIADERDRALAARVKKQKRRQEVHEKGKPEQDVIWSRRNRQR